jgi:hypothetical protein
MQTTQKYTAYKLIYAVLLSGVVMAAAAAVDVGSLVESGNNCLARYRMLLSKSIRSCKGNPPIRASLPDPLPGRMHSNHGLSKAP